MCHSPLTGIFLIRSNSPVAINRWGSQSQSPDGDFFDPEHLTPLLHYLDGGGSQSPDGDFFDPETHYQGDGMQAIDASQSPDGDFFDPEKPYSKEKLMKTFRHSPLTGIFLIRRT